MRPSALLAARAGEQALRTQQQDDDHDGVDHEGPELGDVVFAGHVGDTDQQRGDERSGDARGAADCHHDQKIDHVFERKGGVEAENLAPSAPPRPARPDPKAKVRVKTALTLMPRPRATRASSTDARNLLPNRVLERMSCRPTVSSPQTTMISSR